ncbi:MAG: Uma2 family endonuclease [Deltaproteobacteria bacterium]|nr:Uma2 family endonuclease [Deltaproteobacteria bacterium]
MVDPADRRRLTPAEYLELERGSEQRHEYVDGEIFAMSGGTREHSLTATNIARELGNALAAKPCEVHSSDMRIGIPAAKRYFYADVSVVCGRPEVEDPTRDTLLNPKVIVEVLSDSTEAYDRGDKFRYYRAIASLREFVLASQKEPRIEVFTRQPDETWLLRIFGPDDEVTLSSVGCSFDVRNAYLRVFDGSS